MIDKSSTKPPQDSKDVPLNPSLTREIDKTYTSDQDGSDPMETVSVQKDEGAIWPMIWAVATIASIIIALVMFLF